MSVPAFTREHVFNGKTFRVVPDFSNAALSQFAVTFERRSKATTVKRKHKSLGSLP